MCVDTQDYSSRRTCDYSIPTWYIKPNSKNHTNQQTLEMTHADYITNSSNQDAEPQRKPAENHAYTSSSKGAYFESIEVVDQRPEDADTLKTQDTTNRESRTTVPKCNTKNPVGQGSTSFLAYHGRGEHRWPVGADQLTWESSVRLGRTPAVA